MTIESSTFLDAETAQRKYGPWAVIAGASDGTGASYARQLASLGLNPVLISRRADPLNKLASEIDHEFHVQTRVLPLDLTDPDAGDRILAATSDLDVGLYISNAGSDGGATTFLGNPADRWRRLININVQTVVDTVYGFAQRMTQRGGGGIIIMTSNAALGGTPSFAMYSATKAFEMTMAEGLWGEFQGTGIDVLGVIVTSVDTPTLRRGTEGTNFDPSMAMTPDDVTRAALGNLAAGPLLFFEHGPEGPQAFQIRDQRKERLSRMIQFTEGFLKQK